MSNDFYDATIVLSAVVGMCAMYTLGRRHGIAAEFRRVQYLIDVTRQTVSSWDVEMLDEAIGHRISVNGLRQCLRKDETRRTRK